MFVNYKSRTNNSWGFHFLVGVCIKSNALTWCIPRKKLCLSCVFIYHTTSDHFKALSQAPVNVVLYITLKFHSLIFNNQHRINYRLKDPCCPGLSAHLNSLIAHGMQEKEFTITWQTLSCKWDAPQGVPSPHSEGPTRRAFSLCGS